jgi:2-aminoadipate transaminase
LKKSRRAGIVAQIRSAAGHPIYLLEDAAYRELGFANKSPPSALATPFHQRVIYTGTYSKPFATGIRVGFGLLPNPLFRIVVNIKGNHDFGSSNLLLFSKIDFPKTFVGS